MNYKVDLTDKRKVSRVDFRLPVEIFCPETESSLRGVSVNISLCGILFELQDRNVADDFDGIKKCMARLIFHGKSSKLIIDEIIFFIRRVENNMVALEFNEPLEWFLLFAAYRNKQMDD